MGAGILPIAIHLGKIYLLFSREYINANVNPGLWCDFGGAKDNNESYKQTAIREGWEESSGILGSKTTVKTLLETKLRKIITLNGYRTYIVEIKYDKNLPHIFRQQFLNIKQTRPHLICKNGLYEKDMIRWIELADLKKNLPIFRPWYKSIVKEIIKEFS